jgi:hypothetical protein
MKFKFISEWVATFVSCRRTPSCTRRDDRRQPRHGKHTIGGATAPS